MAEEASVETTASWSARAAVRAGREVKSTGRTVTVEGKVCVLLLRVRTVMVKPAARSSARIAGPRFPVACDRRIRGA